MRTRVYIALMLGLMLVALAQAAEFEGKCPQCVKESKKSVVTVLGSTSTLLATHQYYDKDGNYHFNDPNHLWTSYKCSYGHKFSVVSTNDWGTLLLGVDGLGIVNWQTMTNGPPVNTNAPDITIYGGAIEKEDTILSWETGKITFFPYGSNSVSFVSSNGTFKAVYDCGVDEAAKAVLDAIQKAGNKMGYFIITKEDAKLLVNSLYRLKDWEKAAAEYRRISKELEKK